jgi:hypothetical protein
VCKAWAKKDQYPTDGEVDDAYITLSILKPPTKTQKWRFSEETVLK